MTDTLVTTLRSYADREREHAENNRIVAELLQPQIDIFNGREKSHNTYAVRLAVEHQSGAARDEAFADELDLAADTIESLNQRVIDLKQICIDLEDSVTRLIKNRTMMIDSIRSSILLDNYQCGEPCCKDIPND